MQLCLSIFGLATLGVQAMPLMSLLGLSPSTSSLSWTTSDGPTSLVLVPVESPPPTATPSTSVQPITLIDGPDATSIITEPAVTSTVTIIAPPTFITVHAKPKTQVVTVTTSPSQPKRPVNVRPSWAPPPHYTNLSCFNITKFACGQDNVQLTDTSQSSTSASSTDPTIQSKGNTALQLFYPKGSINPGNNAAPNGGADFYASPLDLCDSRNVSMEYSVFFPEGFQWVKGGKLPGLYGGRPGCSGGDAAEDCFNTRLMWRAGGAGELYLYAPKTKQGPNVCSTPPKCDCNAAYGLSIGRGSFYWSPGNWTTVRQTVYLNTPGMQDGTFSLDVNGQRVMDVSGVYYREGLETLQSFEVQSESLDLLSRSTTAKSKLESILDSPLNLGPSRETVIEQDTIIDSLGSISEGDDDDQDVLGDGLEHPLTDDDDLAALKDGVVTITAAATKTVVLPPLLPTTTVTMLPDSSNMMDSLGSKKPPPPSKPVGFVGIFFSTFFGGHDITFATPQDQKTWFRGFSVAINDGV